MNREEGRKADVEIFKRIASFTQRADIIYYYFSGGYYHYNYHIILSL
jgi:hypothetical protein